VFVAGNDLPQRWKNHDHFQIAELGFGTGLNLLETWWQWCQHRSSDQHLYFTSFEAYPLEADAIFRAMSTWPDLSGLAQKLVKCLPDLNTVPAPWKLDSQTTLTIVKAQALKGVSGWHKKAHAWYLDGFSPRCNADMWSPQLMTEVFAHTHDTGTFATYTSAGWVRRNLQSSGFDVKKVPGHGAKRHMLTGVRERA
jgi:tRNA U34 5-methylaminomethyl-2-thiouridine-forming methyltransferase MnmC